MEPRLRLIARRRGDDRFGDTVVSPGPEDVLIPLQAGERIEGKLSSGRPYDRARILALQDGIQVDAYLEADGTFSLRGLSRGEWSLSLTHRTEKQGYAIEWGADLRRSVEAGSRDVLVD